MKRFLLFLFIAILLSSSPAQPLQALECKRPDSKAEEAINRLLKDLFPVKRTCETPVKGVYEVIGEQNRIIYVDPSSGSIFIGILIREGENLTDKRQVALNKEFVERLPLDRAVKMGSGPKKVIKFSDPDCPFCRRAHGYFKNRKDVTLYIFLFPITGQNAYTKSLHILCSENPTEEYDKALTGQYDNNLKALKPCDEKKALLEEHLRLGREAGVDGTPAFFIEGRFIRGFNRPVIERLLQR